MEEKETFQQKVAKVAARFKDCHYYFLNWAQLNEQLDMYQDDKPVICFLLPPTGYFDIRQNGDTIVDNPVTEITFIAPGKMDQDTQIADVIIERMKYLAKCFLRELNKSGYFDIIDKTQITYETVLEPRTDDAYIGVTVTLPISDAPFYLCGETKDFGFE